MLGEITANSASGSTNATNITSNTNLVHSSGNFLLGEITANSASGAAISGYAEAIAGGGGGGGDGLPYSSGDYFLTEIRANSASGAANTDLINASGDFLLGEITANSASGSTNATNITSNTNLVHSSGNFLLGEITANSASGAAISGYAEAIAGGGGGSSYTAGSGLTLVGTEFNVYGGSGNFEYLELATDNNVVPKLKFLGSGTHDTPINLEVHSSFQSATGSGTALLFQGLQGQLFSITDNLSSGTIFNVSDITGLPMLEITASGDVEIGEFADTITIHQPILLSGGVPSNTTNKLYNDAGTLKFNGSAVGGGGGGDGLPYSSGDYFLTEIRANSASGAAISGYAEAIAGGGGGGGDGLPYSSGDYFLTEIRANSASGAANTDLINASGDFLLGEITANSASGSTNANTNTNLVHSSGDL